NIYKDFGMKKTFIIPNVHIQERGGKVIFGQEKTQGNGTAIEMFSIIIADNDTSNASGVIDFVYMGDNTKIIHDSLLVSLLIKKEDTTLKSIVLQAEWEKGYTLLQENMYYTFVDNVFTIWAGYTQKYAAFDYNVRILTSREGETHFSVVRQNQGYIQDTMTSIGNELTPINKIEGNEPTTIKKAVSKSLKKAKGLLK
ncbi:TPA: glycosyl transferase family 2, partial [Enterococcus faecalis]|nr:glycosyl transferase family 2 [Enterococcus faecalis]